MCVRCGTGGGVVVGVLLYSRCGRSSKPTTFFLAASEDKGENVGKMPEAGATEMFMFILGLI